MPGIPTTNSARLSDFAAFPFHEAGAAPLAPDLMNPSEQAAREDLAKLTRAVQRGDEEAFGRFYDRYSLRIYKHLLVLARGNEDEAWEVLQTVLLKLSKRFQVFDDEGRFWAWLRQVARNAFLDHCRARGRAPDFISLEAMGAEPQGSLPAEHFLCASLRKALDGLPPADRELLRAAYVDGQPLGEIAGETGQTYKAIESRLGRLRRKLKTGILTHLRHEQRT
jgi:RNA polymerase sigma-70 factor (ECF subfamily)